MSNNNEALPFALMNWIKKDQEERRKHAESMTKRNAKDDEVFMEMLTTLFTKKLTIKEKIMLKGLCDYKTEGKNFSTAQKSMITTYYYSKQ